MGHALGKAEVTIQCRMDALTSYKEKLLESMRIFDKDAEKKCTSA